MSDTLRTQRDVTRIALGALTDTGFALAGGSAVREHGITTRPTEDVDLFTSHPDADAFSAAVGMVIDALRDAGYQVTQTRTAEQFARLHITSVSKASVIVDMGVDWRMNQPTPLDIGPVLSLEDAVGNKVAALFSRGEPRDYLDVDAIRGWGGFSDTDREQREPLGQRRAVQRRARPSRRRPRALATRRGTAQGHREGLLRARTPVTPRPTARSLVKRNVIR